MKAILSIAIILILVGCATNIEKAKIDGNSIKNATVGFHGYESIIPKGYKVVDSDDATRDSILSHLSLKLNPNKFSKGLGGIYIRDEIVLRNESKDTNIVFSVVEYNIPGTFSQIPRPYFGRFRELTEKLAKDKFFGEFIEHTPSDSPYCLEFHGYENYKSQRILVSGFFKYGKLNEMIAVVGYTPRSDSSMGEAITQIMRDTKIH